MKKSVIFIVVLVLSFISRAGAEVYNLERDFYGSNHRLRLNIPETVDPIRGILIFGNGANGDTTSMATNRELVAFAESYDFAVLGTGYWYNFSQPDDSEMLLFEDMLGEFADMSGHPELVNAPWLPMGHSNGGQMSYGFNAKRPSKVIAFITSKGAYYNIIAPQTESLLTPGILIAGEVDTQLRRDNIRTLFEINRPRGALWAWVEEQGTGHDEGDSRQLVLPFLAECVRLRYPADQSPVDGPVQLKNLHESDGWLVDQTSWHDDLVGIYPYDDAPGDKRDFGWVPSEKIARDYQAFSSYRKASISAWTDGTLVEAPAALTYGLRLAASGRRGDSLAVTEFYMNGVFIGESDPPEDMEPVISIETDTGGFHTFTAIVTYNSGVSRVTNPRRVFVVGPPPASAFEEWAIENLPEDLRGPDDMLFDDGITNIERFAFGLSLTEPLYNFQPLQPAEPFIENINGTDYVVYTYQVNEAARISGLNIMPQVSPDGLNWTNIINIDDPAFGTPQFVSRDGDTVTLKYPSSDDQLFFRVAVSDTYKGVSLQ